MKSKSVILGVAAAVAVAMGSSAARATILVYDFTFSSSTQVGNYSGQFDVNSATDLIVGMSGSGADIGKITALEAPGTFAGNDNLFSATAPYLDFNGVSFDTSTFGIVNLYYIASGNDYSTGSFSIGDNFGNLTVTAQAVPEPLTLSLFGAGLLGALAMRRRKATHTAA